MALPLLHLNPTQSFELQNHPYQQAFLKARRLRLPDGSRAFNRFGLFSGRRGGKTTVGAVAGVEEARTPRSLGWCVAPTYGDLHDYVIPAVMRVLPQSWILPGPNGWSAAHQTLTLRNLAQIAFRSADDPERMRGPGLDWLWLDEARKTSKLVWETVRPALADRRGAAWITTSPNGFDWAYHSFYKLAANPKHRRPGFWAVRYRTIDNPAIPLEEIEEARATTDELWFKQEWEGEFVSFEGAIYGHRVTPCVITEAEEQETDKSKNRLLQIIPTWPRIPREFPVLVGIDPGADHPFAAVKIVATHAGLVVVDEYRKRMTAYGDHVDQIRQWSYGHDQITYVVDRTATQAQIELAALGIPTAAAENSVVLGIQRVQAWLKTARIFFVESRCGLLLEEMQNYRWKNTYDPNETAEEKSKESPWKVGEDLCDALRYAVMSWPELPAKPLGLIGRDPATVPMESRELWELERRAARGLTDDETEWKDGTGDFFATPWEDTEDSLWAA